MSKFCVYFVFCVVNGRGYIGKTNNIKKRWSGHCGKFSSCKHLSRAVQKYGREQFRVWVLHSNLSEEQAYSIEKNLIDQLDMIKNGYNMVDGGSGFGSGDKNPMYGRTGELHPMYGRTGEKSPNSKLTDRESVS